MLFARRVGAPSSVQVREVRAVLPPAVLRPRDAESVERGGGEAVRVLQVYEVSWVRNGSVVLRSLGAPCGVWRVRTVLRGVQRGLRRGSVLQRVSEDDACGGEQGVREVQRVRRLGPQGVRGDEEEEGGSSSRGQCVRGGRERGE